MQLFIFLAPLLILINVNLVQQDATIQDKRLLRAVGPAACCTCAEACLPLLMFSALPYSCCHLAALYASAKRMSI
jgi:hypothetical protein